MRPLFLTQTVASVQAALDGASGLIAVVDWPRLGRQLAERRQVLQISSKLRALRKQSGDRLYAEVTGLPLAAGSLSAIIVPGVATRDDWEPALAEARRVLVDGGTLVMIDRVEPAEATRRILCAGLAEIEQRTAGRTVVTSGLAYELPAAATA